MGVLSRLKSGDALDQHLFDLTNSFCRVQTLRADLRAVHDGVAAIELEWVFKVIETLSSRFVAAVDQPAISMEQGCRAEIFVAIPPIGWA